MPIGAGEIDPSDLAAYEAGDPGGDVDAPLPDWVARAKELAEDPVFQQTMWLVRNGIPFDVAHAFEPWEALAHSVVFTKFEAAPGTTFDWRALRYNTPS